MQKDSRKTQQKNSKNSNEALMFLKTFIATFLIIMVIATPIFARVGEFLDLTPGTEDGPVLEEEIDFAQLIPTDSPFFDAFINTNRVNILLLGVDNHNLTDTIMLASFDVDNRFLDVISIPRDTYFYRGPGFIDRAHHKINAVFRGNPVNTAVAVSEILMNIPINYYVMLSHDGVAAIIDEIGGVPMYIPFHMRYDDPRDTPPLRIDIPAGHQVLDGEMSIGLLRFRTGNPGFRSFPDADLGRIRMQQEFMKSAARESLGLNLPNVARAAFEHVESDMPLRTMIHLATRAIGIEPENIRTHTMPIRNVSFFVNPDRQGIADMLTEIYSMEPVVIDDDEDEDEDLE